MAGKPIYTLNEEHFQNVLIANCDIAPTKFGFHNNAWYLKISGNQQVGRVKRYLYPDGSYPYLARKHDAMSV